MKKPKSIVILGVMLSALSCSRPTQHSGKTLQLTPCSGKSDTLQALRAVNANCGELSVAENPEQPDRQIKLFVAVIPALAKSPKPEPLFVLAGGPGQAASEIGPFLVPIFKDIHAYRDIVLVDQRGTGSSNKLDCNPSDNKSLAAMFRDLEPEQLQKCVEDYPADLRYYTTPLAVDDLERVRKALGYQKINLYGGSYGTRVALVYMRRHGQSLHRVVVDGLAPTALRMPSNFGPDMHRAFDLLIQACKDNPTCHSTYPSFVDNVKALVKRLEKPVLISMTHPLTGEQEQVEVTSNDLASLVFGILYSSELSALLPLAIDKAAAGDFSVLVSTASMMGQNAKLAIGMHLAVLCNEDLAVADQRAAESGFLFPTGFMHSKYQKQCAHFPKATLPDNYYQPIQSTVPTLILSGELDPVTPPRWGDFVKKNLTNSQHIVVPGVGHGAAVRGCLPKLIARFLDQEKTLSQSNPMDTTCVTASKRFPFFVNSSGFRSRIAIQTHGGKTPDTQPATQPLPHSQPHSRPQQP